MNLPEDFEVKRIGVVRDFHAWQTIVTIDDVAISIPEYALMDRNLAKLTNREMAYLALLIGKRVEK